MDDSLEEPLKDLVQELKPYIAKSYIEEISRLKQDALECCQGLEDLLDMDGLEAGKWSIDDEDWPLNEGGTVEDAIKLILSKGLMAKRDFRKVIAAFKLGSEGYFSCQDGKAFISSFLLEMPPVKLIENMLDYDYLSLFECIFLVGYYTDNSGIISHSIDIASQALMGGVISPRDPETNLKMKDLPKKRLTGEPVLPDLSWLLSFDEAEQWAVNSFDLSFKELKDQFKEPPNQEAQKQPSDTMPINEQAFLVGMAMDSEWNTKNEREFLYRTIGGLALLLIEKTQSNRFGSRDKPNKKGIYSAIEEILENMGFKTDGQTKTNLNTVLSKALDSAMTPKND